MAPFPLSETTTAASTPFSLPSGVVNIDGWDYIISASTQFTWNGDLNSAEHTTTYFLTQDDGSVETTSTEEPTCATAAPAYVKAALDGHNTKRAAHSANAVVWDDDLACIAQCQAESCIWDRLTYVNGGGYGQNLAGGMDVASSVDMWYGEAGGFANYYGEQSPPFVAGHFTQLVWAYTTSIGCATYDCDSGTREENSATGALTVCNYFAGGNMEGFYGVYVLPPVDY